MATLEKFEDLEVWQKSRILSKEVYKISAIGKFAKDFELVKQIHGASGSTMDNIAEGFERGGKGEFIQFLGFSKGSNGEVRSQLYRALDNNYITKEIFEDLYNKSDEISRMINGLISYLNKTEIKGFKYKK